MPEASLLISGGSGMRIPLGMRFAEAAGTALDQASAAQLLPHPAAWCRRKAEHNLFGQGFYMGQSDPVLGGNIHWSETWWLWQAALNVLMQLKTESQSRRKDAKRSRNTRSHPCSTEKLPYPQLHTEAGVWHDSCLAFAKNTAVRSKGKLWVGN